MVDAGVGVPRGGRGGLEERWWRGMAVVDLDVVFGGGMEYLGG